MANTKNGREPLSKERIVAALDKYGGMEKAAVLGLGYSRGTVSLWLREHGLKPRRFHVLVPVDQEQSTE